MEEMEILAFYSCLSCSFNWCISISSSYFWSFSYWFCLILISNISLVCWYFLLSSWLGLPWVELIELFNSCSSYCILVFFVVYKLCVSASFCLICSFKSFILSYFYFTFSFNSTIFYFRSFTAVYSSFYLIASPFCFSFSYLIDCSYFNN